MNYIEINRNLWNKRTNIHFESDFYKVPEFIKGSDSLNSIELELLGNIQGKKILHLQCHFGQDSISLARKGADVTGIALSDKAIHKAKQLSIQTGVDVRFICCDVYGLKEVLNEQFDMVFTSYGVVGWLPDMKQWADVVQHFLKPGGIFVMAEFHPVVWMFSYDFSKIEYAYMDSEAIVEELEGTYTDDKDFIKEKSVNWNHGLSTVINALIKAGISIEDFQEYNYSPYDCFENTIELEKGKFQIKGLENKLPMVYSILGRKKEL